MPKSEQKDLKLDNIFNALGDNTRRKVFERLGSGPATVSELASRFDMTLPSFVQHLGILERSGLVRSEKKGRVRTFYIVPKKLKTVDKWIKGQRTMWKKCLDHPEVK